MGLVAMNKIIEINKNVTILQAKNSLLNASVIENDDSLLVIDTFLLPKDSKDLYEYCLSKKKAVKYIVNTHWHSDHCYGNRFFDSFKPIIIAHQSYWNTIAKEKNIISPNRPNIINKKLLRYPHITFSEKLELKDFKLKISHAPGHSEDSTRIYSWEHNIYWVGDNVLNSDDNRIAVPYFYWGNAQELLQELESLALKIPETIIPGHGLPCDNNKIVKDIIYLQNILLKHSKTSLTCSEQAEILLEDCYPVSKGDVFWVEKMHQLNLNKLNSTEV